MALPELSLPHCDGRPDKSLQIIAAENLPLPPARGATIC